MGGAPAAPVALQLFVPIASALVPLMVSPVTTPWSATASSVFSGMVLTVLGPTNSVT